MQQDARQGPLCASPLLGLDIVKARERRTEFTHIRQRTKQDLRDIDSRRTVNTETQVL